MLHLREGQYLRRGAVLLFHPDPGRFFAGAFVKIGCFTSETDLAYQDVIEGNLFAQVERTVDLLCTKYARAAISYEGIYRRETLPVPREALREAVLNAVAHRDYGNSAPIQIWVDEHRIALWNPGSLPPDWNLAKLMGRHASVPPNPAIANALFRAGMVEPQWVVESDGLRLEFLLTPVDQDQRQPESQPESRPESQPESLRERVLHQLATWAALESRACQRLGPEDHIGAT